MAVYDQIRPQMDGHLFAGRPTRFLTGLRGRIATWTESRATRRALSRLSDRDLSDIGLCRGDIDRIARQTYRP